MKRIAIKTADKSILLNYENNTFCELSEFEEPEPGKVGRIRITETSIKGKTNRNPGYQTYNCTYGCINDKLEEIIPCIYDNIQINPELVVAEKYIHFDGKSRSHYIYFDYSGHQIYESIFPSYYAAITMLHNKWTDVVDFGIKLDSHNIYQVKHNIYHNFSLGKKENKIGVVSIEGKTIKEPEEYDVATINRQHLFMTFKKGEQIDYGFWFEGLKEWILYLSLHNVKSINRYGPLIVIDDDTDSEILNEYNETPFDEQQLFTSRLISIFKDTAIFKNNWTELYGLEKIVKRNSRTKFDNLLDYKYDSIQEFSTLSNNPKYFCIKKNGNQGIYNVETKSFEIDLCVPCTYEFIPGSIGDNCAAFKDNEKTGFMNSSGEILFYFSPDIRISSIQFFYSGIARVNIYGEREIETLLFKKDGTYKKWEKPIYRGDDDRDYGSDTWDAMTDGMHGDYPGSGVDYDDFG